MSSKETLSPQGRIKSGAFDRFYIFHPKRDDLAWSGSRWVLTENGLPASPVQVCNFDSAAQAEEYLRALQLENGGCDV